MILDYFFFLSSCWRLITKLLFRGVLIDHLVELDSVELGWLFFTSLGESCWHHTTPVQIRCCHRHRTCDSWGVLLASCCSCSDPLLPLPWRLGILIADVVNFYSFLWIRTDCYFWWLVWWWFWGEDFPTQTVPFSAAAHFITARDLTQISVVNDNT